MIKELFSYIGKIGRKNLTAAVISNMLASLCTAGILLTVLRMLTHITDIGREGLSVYWAALIGILFLKFLCNIIYSKTSHYAGFDIEINLKEKIIRKLKTFSLGFYSDERVGDVSTIVQSDVEKLQVAVSHFGSKAAGDIITAAVIGVALFILDWRIGLIMISLLPVAILTQIKGTGKSLRLRKINAENLADMVSRFVEYTKGIPLLKAFPENRFFHANLTESAGRFEQSSRTDAKVGSGLMSKFQLPFELCFGLVALCGGLLVLKGTISVDVYVCFIVFSQEFYKPFGEVTEYQMNYTHIKDSYGRISKLLNAASIERPAAPQKPVSYDIRFEQVGFRYEDDSFALTDVDIKMEQGTLTALVGHSGSGKTTITNLLLRFWDIESGAIRIGGVDIRDMDYDELLSHVGIVMQNVILFSGTIYENIKLGNRHATRGQVEEAAKKAMLHDEIMNLPKGYDTLLGENGAGLSGGQRQRLSIARVLLRDTPIVLLDEITSNIDATNEVMIQKAVSNLAKDRTVLVIAHHLKTIRSADQIIVFDAGRIAEKGTHDELLSKRGIYHTLWSAQERTKEWEL